eukprot:CAMPEP_0175125048 /NCGR_PEP_ID=MMETSP0087-20121206/3106_1 /TAXON_ID=136419 /ORGANISM="Unknown Unknown, Strain D1" /LENGTH=323 /DNA_ID=CAMNT_0016406855 /DNA_START=78 /DNA_END=1046 /DNA_ORIENTATION=+
MKGVYDLRDKDTGDAAGDTSFVISKKNNAFDCRKDPDSFQCHGLAQFSGDDVNSTDLILEIEIQADGQWGVYLECNPLNASDPHGPWTCENGLSPPPPPDFPQQCQAMDYDSFGDYCVRGVPDRTVQGTETDCCNFIASQPKGTYNFYNYFALNNTCNLYKSASMSKITKCEAHNVTFAVYNPPDPNSCKCERVYRAVGRQNMTMHGGQFSIAGGLWFSHPSGGQCGVNEKVGDQSGCTYKVLKVTRAINATCMYKAIDAAVEAMDPSCFASCPQPHNVTSDCYLGCYSAATKSAAKSDLVKPWNQAFEPTGCPQVPIDPALW